MSEQAIIEKVGSRSGTVGVDNPSRSLLFLVKGTNDLDQVEQMVEGELPAVYRGLFLQSYQTDHLGNGVWNVDAKYGRKEPKKAGEYTFSFDTTGGTAHITQSFETVHRYGVLNPGQDPAVQANEDGVPDFKGAIGVNGDAVAGVDVPVPKFAWTEEHVFPKELLTADYLDVLFVLTGCTNQDEFYARLRTGVKKKFQPFEVTFHGASGSQRGADDASLSFKFTAEPNAVVTTGGITGIKKRGSDYVWYRYTPVESQSVLVQVPQYGYVERVLRLGKFALLGLPE